MDNKKRIHELAKMLKTSSKRIVEVLSEIGIYPKSYMSALTDDELDRFYKHIGYSASEQGRSDENAININNHGDKDPAAKKVENLRKQQQSNQKSAGVVVQRRIVYGPSTENKVTPTQPQSQPQRNGYQQNKKAPGNQNKGGRMTASSGLRSGYEVRSGSYDNLGGSRADDLSQTKNVQEVQKVTNDTPVASAEPTPTVRRIKRIPAVKPETDAVVKPAEPVKEETKVETTVVVPEVKEEVKEEVKVEIKPEVKEEVKPEVKEEVKPEIKEEPEITVKEEVKIPEEVETVKAEPVEQIKPEVVAEPVSGKKDFKKEKNEYVPEESPILPGKKNQQKGFKNQPKSDKDSSDEGNDGKRDRYSDRNQDRQDRGGKKENRKESSKPGQQQGKDKYNKAARQLVGVKKGVSEAYNDDYHSSIDDDHIHGKKGNKPSKKDFKQKGKEAVVAQHNAPVIAVLTNVTLPAQASVKDFAESIKKTSADVIKKLMMMGVLATQNQIIDFDTMALIANEFGIKAEQEVVVTDEELLFDDSDDDSNDEGAVPRAPVVVVMGHVDHGKTSLLDAIRSTSVTSGEAGGITQHIGAYTVRINDRKITFLDTPGHEAFTAMRARGAQVTDVAILVVAADDGVMPQTVEAINHAKAAKVSIVIAINKIDKNGANIDRVMQELAEHEIIPEAWGGDIPFVPVSAKTGENIELLLETVILSADILELKANPNKQARGTIIEAKLDKNKGPVATLLVQRGTLKVGDAIVSGTTFGHIRTMVDDKERAIKKAGPSTPVEITGLPEVPEAGEVFYAVKDERLAKHLIETRKTEMRAKALQGKSKVSLDDLFSQIQQGNVKELNLIVKADVQGSVEAVKQSLEKLSDEHVRINIIHGAVGAINESDVTFAEVSNAIIIGFNVRPSAAVTAHAEASGVDMRLYRIIYDAIEDIKAAMTGMLDPEFKEVVVGHVEVRQIFRISGVGTVAGAYVTSGKIMRTADVRLVRDGIVVFEGKLASLKRFKDDAKEVLAGFECGLSFEKFNDVKEGDNIECYVMEEIKR